MKRILFLLFAIGTIVMSSVSMAAMSNSRIRQETRFLTDKMAYELGLNTNQYNDAYEINYDFIYSVNGLLDRVARGDDRATDRYYSTLDIRNDDLRWILTASQYRRFMGADYFYRPIYAGGNNWNFRIYITYTNHNHFYFGRPYHYNSYCGGHYRTHYNNSYYRGRYTHERYSGNYSLRNDRVYHSNRRSDFGQSTTRPSTPSRRENSEKRESSSSVRNNRPTNRENSSSSRVERSNDTRKESDNGVRRSSSRSRSESSSGRRN